MNATDRLITVFEAKGAGSLLKVFTDMQKAELDYVQAQDQINHATTAKQADAGLKKLAAATQLYMNANLRAGTIAGATFATIAFGVKKAVDGYSRLGEEIQNIKDLTGSSTGDAAKVKGLMQAAGVNDAGATKTLLGLNKAVFSEAGQGALARLGLPANANQSGLGLFNQVADRLGRMQDGIRKTQIAQELFGESGAASMLPLLRLTREQREQAMSLADVYDTRGLKAIQNFDFATNTLGASIQNKLIGPLAAALVPTLTLVVNGITWIVNGLHTLDQMSGGSLSFIAAWATVAIAITAAITAMQRFSRALGAAIMLARQLAVVQSIVAALSNPLKGALVVGAAVASTAAITALIRSNSGEASKDSEKAPMVGAAREIRVAAERLSDAADVLKGKGLPNGINQIDIAALQRQQALDAIT